MLSRYHRELAAAAEAAAAGQLAYDPRPHLFPAALAGYDDPTRHRAWPWGRGSSKTTTAQDAHASMGTAYPGAATVYMSTTAIRAVDVAWPDFLALAARIGAKTHKGRHIVTWPGAARTFVTGADRIGLFDRKRGIKGVVFVHLDECQDWESTTLEYAVTKVFAPRLGDMEKRHGIKGRILLTGTGGKEGTFWHRACVDPELEFGVTAEVTQWDNPHIADPEGEFVAACKLAKVPWRRLEQPILSRWSGRPRWVDTDDAMTRREWFAEFNAGGALQVFRQPFVLVPRAGLPTQDVNLVVCADFGTVDACAAACWLFTPHDRRAFLVRATKQTGLSASQQVKFVREFAAQCRAEYKPRFVPFIVGDGGGLGKALIMDIQMAESAWEVDPAEKQDKVPNMRILAGDLRDGTACIVDDLEDFVEDLKAPEWHPDHVGEKLKGHSPDQVDAAYMGYRKVKERHRFIAPPPEKDEEQKLRDAEIAEVKRRQERARTGREMLGGRRAVDAWKR